MDINNLDTINSKVASYSAKLLPVIKNRTNKEIKFLYDFGFREFAENRLDDFKQHVSVYKDASYHFIAPIQSRKLNEITQHFKYIHTISRIKEVDILKSSDTKCNFLIQINIDDEDSKSGIKLEEVNSFLENISSMKKIHICGFMIIPKPEKNIENLKKTFNLTKNLLIKLSKKHKNLSEISMGMSRDYELAIKEGSTIVRLGESIFGARNK